LFEEEEGTMTEEPIKEQLELADGQYKTYTYRTPDRLRGYTEAELELAEKTECPVCENPLEQHPLRNAKSCFIHGDYVIEFQNGSHIVKWKPMNY
jgi:hypothetical protein